MIIRLSELDADLIELALSHLKETYPNFNWKKDHENVDRLLDLFAPHNRTDKAIVD